MDRAQAQQFAGTRHGRDGHRRAGEGPLEGGRRWPSGCEQQLGYPYRDRDVARTRTAALFAALKLEKLAMGLVIFFIMRRRGVQHRRNTHDGGRVQDAGDRHPRSHGADAARRRHDLPGPGRVIGLVGTGIGTVLGLAVSYVVDRSGLIPINPDGLLHRPAAGARRGPSTWLVVVGRQPAGGGPRHDPAVTVGRRTLQPVEAIRAE